MKDKQQREIIAAIRQQVPRNPGIYKFIDQTGTTLYIGKSVNLRQRMLSYFRSDQSGMENRIRQMVFSVRDFTYQETETELLALLLEDKLIKEELPWYNIRQREYTQYQYLALTDDPFPTWKILDHEADAANLKIFGPFRDRYFVADVLDILQRQLHLRSCQDPDPFRRSLNFEMGLCTGPCRQKISAADYSSIVAKVIGFLHGDETVVLPRLDAKMTACVRSLEFEKASEYQKRIDFCRRFCVRQQFIHRFSTQNLEIISRDDGKRRYLFADDCVTLSAEATALTSIGTLHFSASGNSDKRHQLDRANIVFSWLKKRRDTYQYRFA